MQDHGLKLGAMLAKKLQCLRESYRGEATPKQGRALSEVSGGISKPSGRAGLEQLQDRVRTG